MKDIEKRITDWHEICNLLRCMKNETITSQQKSDYFDQYEIKVGEYFKSYQTPFNPMLPPKR